jgi:azurin
MRKVAKFASLGGLLWAITSAPAFAAVCETTVESNDAMQFNTKSIKVDKSCKQFTVTLKHVGTLSKVVMGHNLVIAKTADVPAVISNQASQNYVKPGDPRVIAHTKVIGGGESDSVAIPVSKLKGADEYTFFCSVPGHSAIMRGTIAVN